MTDEGERQYVAFVVDTLQAAARRFFGGDQLPRDGRLIILIAAGVSYPGSGPGDNIDMHVGCNVGSLEGTANLLRALADNSGTAKPVVDGPPKPSGN